MWKRCDSCDGTGTNPIEGTCITCGGNGAVFEECNIYCCPDCNGNEPCHFGEECPQCRQIIKEEVASSE